MNAKDAIFLVNELAKELRGVKASLIWIQLWCAVILLAIGLLLLMGATASADQCKATVSMHVFTAMAQSTCLFREYDEDLTTRAWQCGKIMPHDELQEAMNTGQRNFDDGLHMLGKDQLCKDILNVFSDVVR